MTIIFEWDTSLMFFIGPRVELFSEVPKERRCHMRRLFWLLLVRCMERVFFESQKRKTTIRHQCVCPNRRMKGPLCLWEDDWMGGGHFAPSLCDPHVWVLQRGAEAHRWAVLSLFLTHTRTHTYKHAHAVFFFKAKMHFNSAQCLSNPKIHDAVRSNKPTIKKLKSAQNPIISIP